MEDFGNIIKAKIQESIFAKVDLLKNKVSLINEIANVMINAYQNKKKVVWFGNGGSAADAQHMACELVSRFYFDRPALPSIALTTNTSELTAIANDYNYDKVFSRQVEALVNEGDVVVGITTSGNSPNVIEAMAAAKKIGATTVAFTGETGGKLAGTVDYLMNVPSKDTPRIQESHVMVGHIVCDLVESKLFGTSENG